jgi:hypothetical protein
LVLKSGSPIERQILDYLTENPAAHDTLRGVVEWWLLKQTIVQTTTDVERALANLVSKGKLYCWMGPDGSVHYCHQRKDAKSKHENN